MVKECRLQTIKNASGIDDTAHTVWVDKTNTPYDFVRSTEQSTITGPQHQLLYLIKRAPACLERPRATVVMPAARAI